MKDRIRKVDVNKMSLEQADALSVQIGQEIAKLMDECNNKCNEILNIYGMKTKIHYQLVKNEESDEKSVKTQSLQTVQE